MKVSGLSEMRKRLDDLARRARDLDGQHNIPVEDLLNPSFVSRHTRFAGVQELFDQSGFKIDSQEDLEAIPDREWDAYIASVSSFSNWEEMVGEAGKEWAAKQLGF